MFYLGFLIGHWHALARTMHCSACCVLSLRRCPEGGDQPRHDPSSHGSQGLDLLRQCILVRETGTACLPDVSIPQYLHDTFNIMYCRFVRCRDVSTILYYTLLYCTILYHCRVLQRYGIRSTIACFSILFIYILHLKDLHWIRIVRSLYMPAWKALWNTACPPAHQQ